MFLFSKMSRLVWGTAVCPAKLINGALSSGVKQPGPETIRLLLLTADTNNECSNSSIPILSSWHIYMDDFTFSFI
jgi:hypothetical protein